MAFFLSISLSPISDLKIMLIFADEELMGADKRENRFETALSEWLSQTVLEVADIRWSDNY